ncbi:MAG: flagellar basal body P-ring protein FlgI [Alphaproteobacteria bacterium]|nr:flagellar basal body P-ring protein FlgI [Alphaproteobacteria bacterium]
MPLSPIPSHLFRRSLAAVLAALLTLLPVEAFAYSRIKDLVSVEGVRDNMLIGYGLVVGLNGTGDMLRNAPFTQQSLQTMLERLGVNTRGEIMQTKNVAAVMVTANLPPFASQGTRIDISVGAMGDAKSLQGGTLLVTPLYGADGNIYAVAQGPVTVSGFSARGKAASVTQNVPTAGRIPNGAIVERQTNFKLDDEHSLKLSLHNPDLTTAVRIAQAIDRFIGQDVAIATDPANVKLTIPASYPNGVVGMLDDIDQLRVTPDQSAKVVIDEKTGVIVMGSDVRISTVAIAQGNLTIRVTETPQVSQPAPFSKTGTTTVVPRTQLQISTGKGNKMMVLNQGVSLQKLVDGLNALGVGPRDIISILQAIKAAGALQAQIKVIG